MEMTTPAMTPPGDVALLSLGSGENCLGDIRGGGGDHMERGGGGGGKKGKPGGK
jgi:hypothetical protein